MFLPTAANSTAGYGVNQRSIQVAPGRKGIVYDALPYPGIGSLGLIGVLSPPGKTV
jgi:hypothetical protein